MIKVLNYRKGFATNSSSTHSIIIDKCNVIDTNEVYNEYGWDEFVLKNKDNKLNYLIQQINSSHIVLDDISNSTENFNVFEIKDAIIRNILGDIEYDKGGYVDHQSCWTFPRNPREAIPSKEFIEDLRDYLLDDSVAIIGGNDNDSSEYGSDYSHDLQSWEFIFNNGFKHRYDISQSKIICVKDKASNVWTLFNKKSGEKIRFQFIKGEKCDKQCDLERSYYPELIDYKLTNKCFMNCDFCYQGSNENGIDSQVDVDDIVELMKQLKVFEVALGGGEPTLSKNFLPIINSLYNADIVPNFTTRLSAWLDYDWAEDVMNKCGGIAFSITNIKEAIDISYKLFEMGLVYDSYYEKLNKSKCNFSFNIPMGVFKSHNLIKLFDISNCFNIDITLLGYKKIGRGKSFTPDDYILNLVDAIEYTLMKSKNNYDYYPPIIGIDTCLASELNKFKFLEKINIPRYKYYTEEGKFSMYIDGTKFKYGPSSYSDELYHLNIYDPNSILKEYNKW